MDDWYKRFCEGKKAVRTLSSTPNAVELARAAAILSYRASVLRALKFEGKNSEAMNARQAGEGQIIDFLCTIYESKSTIDINDVAKTWESIYQIYKRNNIEDYTYGNAQKWVNMSIKYYIILLNKFGIDYSKLIEVPVFPVDRIMINHIKKDLSIPFSGNWSDCKDIDALKKYICAVKAEVDKQSISLFEYELNAWN